LNERIRQLAEQAGAETWSRAPMRAVTGLAFTDENLEKFAELIRAEHTQSVIKLCANTINDNLNAEKQRQSNRWDNVKLVLIIIGMIAWVTFWYIQSH
jgi:wyosine [tRNA(Phe)-imidazoG37] synthetase (radical SAM superfamily)